MQPIKKYTSISILGSILIVVGILLMASWIIRQFGYNSDPIIQSPTPTMVPDLLIPTRTPIPLVTRDEESQANNTLAPTELQVSTPRLTMTVKPETITATDDVPTMTIQPDVTITVKATSSPSQLTPGVTENKSTPTQQPSATPEITETEITFPATDGFHIPQHDLYRVGVSLPYGAGRRYGLEDLGVGWVMDWNTRSNPDLPPGIEYVQTVRLMNGELLPNAEILRAVAASRRGSTWLISNEPDVRWQDNITPETYARLYHEAYTAIMEGDSSAIVAAGGISQPSLLRLAYLDATLSAYQSQYGSQMPVNAWQIHNYMLREERNTWGVDIPPGFSEQSGILYSIDDSGNLSAFQSQIYAFRQWMFDRGYGHVPLIISEFGIPMPPDYGFDYDRVSQFLQVTMKFLYNATDPVLGNPADGGRLVQRWCWFSLGVTEYPSGNLLVPPSGDWTPLGYLWRDMVMQ